jgi:hypothetical protein
VKCLKFKILSPHSFRKRAILARRDNTTMPPLSQTHCQMQCLLLPTVPEFFRGEVKNSQW